MKKLLLLAGLTCVLALLFIQANQTHQTTTTRSLVVIMPMKMPTTAVSHAQVKRISQLDPGQYASHGEWSIWAYATCSTAAMTEVINAYGHHYRISEILKVEVNVGAITPQLGLLDEGGIARTVAPFGFKTTWGHHLSLDQVIAAANSGRPVIVGFPPDRYPHGHLVVVIGGNSQSVRIADSSLFDHQVLSRAQFLKWWGGFSAIVTPQ